MRIKLFAFLSKQFALYYQFHKNAYNVITALYFIRMQQSAINYQKTEIRIE